ncbi:coactosin-like protein [Acanthaster planci]|uniref:Coactosin-like protein n=1 Tax=Acanthaster planci TaxID=133434 RepID=A0A8B7ZEG1_ACAPL|nr:coactosin-like protein [Acanthaster planci]
MAKPFTPEAREKLYEAYQDVRDDKSETRWCVAGYPDNGKLIDITATGVDYQEFLELMQDDERIYGFVRYETGDEMSKRAKFAFITWIGPAVSSLQRARVSTDKAFIKDIFTNFGVEVLADDRHDLQEDGVKDRLVKAGGANYGTGR